MKSTKNVAKLDLVIRRIVDAPRDLVWGAWTKPELVKRWWGPGSFTAPFGKMDFRVGDKFLFCMDHRRKKTTGAPASIVK